MVDLMTYIEAQTGRPMSALDVTLENLDTIRSILAYCARQGNGPSA
jgi:hypothetical protein